MNISVVGLGKLGCSMAAAFASRGHSVIGYDVVTEVVHAVARGVAPVAETGLQELLAANNERLRATCSIEEAVLESNITFVVVPTPSDANGAFIIDHAKQAFAGIGAALARKGTPHTVVLTSTVLPGSTRYGLIPALEQTAGRRVGDRIGVCYSPAFIALGSVIRDFLHPDFLLIGETDAAAGDALQAAYAEVMPDAPPVRRMSIENAELTKLAVNTYVTMKISFANMLATLCERIPGGDVDVVSAALGADRRIGRAYLTGALGYGGPCFPRDNQALTWIASALGAGAPLAQATDAINRALPEAIVARLLPRMAGARTVGILGLAYKPETPVLTDSQSVEIARLLAARGLRVLAHDPLAGAAAAPALGPAVQVVLCLEQVVEEADVILLTTPDAAYRVLDASAFRSGDRKKLVIDFWRTLRAQLEDRPEVDYIAVGTAGGNGSAEAMRALWGSAPVAAQAAANS
jgi:UDPglucose 6-dehydrogenase